MEETNLFVFLIVLCLDIFWLVEVKEQFLDMLFFRCGFHFISLCMWLFQIFGILALILFTL
jgi:hypothetical protein